MGFGRDISGTTNVPGTGDATSSQSNPAMPVTQDNDILRLLKGMIEGHTTSMQSAIPQAAMQPQERKLYPQIETAKNEFFSKSGNRRVAFNNMMSNATGIVQTAMQNQEAKKARSLANDLERLLMAAQNPQDPQNAQIINDITSDPKKLKAITEAMSINLLGAEDNRSKDKKMALDMALKKLKESGVETNPLLSNTANMLMSKLPKTAQLTPESQGRMAMTKAGVIPKGTDLINYLRTAGQDQTRLFITQMLVGAKDRDTAAKILNASTQALGRVETEKIAQNAANYRQGLKLQEARDKIASLEKIADKKINAATTSGSLGIKQAKTRLQALTSLAATLQKEITAIGKNPKGFDKAGYQKRQQELQKVSAEIDQIQQQLMENKDASDTDTRPITSGGDSNITQEDDNWLNEAGGYLSKLYGGNSEKTDSEGREPL